MGREQQQTPIPPPPCETRPLTHPKSVGEMFDEAQQFCWRQFVFAMVSTTLSFLMLGSKWLAGKIH